MYSDPYGGIRVWENSKDISFNDIFPIGANKPYIRGFIMYPWQLTTLTLRMINFNVESMVILLMLLRGYKDDWLLLISIQICAYFCLSKTNLSLF